MGLEDDTRRTHDLTHNVLLALGVCRPLARTDTGLDTFTGFLFAWLLDMMAGGKYSGRAPGGEHDWGVEVP